MTDISAHFPRSVEWFVGSVESCEVVHRVSVDPVLKQRFAVDGKEPTTVIVVSVEQAFQHCPKALVRSDLWRAGSAGRPKIVPTLGDFAAARTPGTDSATFDADYARRLPNELY